MELNDQRGFADKAYVDALYYDLKNKIPSGGIPSPLYWPTYDYQALLDKVNGTDPIPAENGPYLLTGRLTSGSLPLLISVLNNTVSPIAQLVVQENGTSGFQDIAFSVTLNSGDATGLANNATVYTASVVVDGVTYPVAVTGSAAQTFNDLCSQIRADLPVGTTVALSAKNIVITSPTTGIASTVATTDGTLFAACNNFVDIETAVDGHDGYYHTWTIEYDFLTDNPIVVAVDSKGNRFLVDISASVYDYFPADGASLGNNITSGYLDITAGGVLTNVSFKGTSALETLTDPATGLTDITIDLNAGISNLQNTFTLTANAIDGNEDPTFNYSGVGILDVAGTLNTISNSGFLTKNFIVKPPVAITSGLLIVGEYYKVETVAGGDDMTGSGFVVVNEEFICTGQPATWTNGTAIYGALQIKPSTATNIVINGLGWKRYYKEEGVSLSYDGTNWRETPSQANNGQIIYTVQKTMTPDQIKAWRATPQTLVPAQGAGLYIVPVPIGTSTFLDFNSVIYANYAAATPSIKISGAASAFGAINTNAITASASTNPVPFGISGGTVSLLANADLVVLSAGAQELTNGDSNITIKVAYMVLKF